MNHTSISDLKAKAKDQLLGNYGIATGSFALLFAFVYGFVVILSSAMTAGASSGAPMIDPNTASGLLATKVFSFVIAVFSSIMSTGYIYLLRRIARGERAATSDIFFVFRNHPDKIIIIAFIMVVIQEILLLPATIVGFGNIDNGKRFLTWIVLYLAGFIISFVIDLYLAMVYMIYIDDPDTPVMDIIKGSISLMRGNCWRYFYMLLSFIGYFILVILSLGIAALWVIPYQTMAIVEFYNDLTGYNDNIEDTVVYES